VLSDFRTYFDLDDFILNELDKALWMPGKVHEPRYGE